MIFLFRISNNDIAMKKFIKKITILSIIGITVFSGAGIITPPKAHADIVTDFVTEIETGLTAGSSAVSAAAAPITAAATFYQQLKSSVFDAIATAIAKQLLMQITMSVVKWINTGFKGSPAFVQNPSQFFQSIGDQTAINFLSSSSTGLMTNPNGAAVRAALASDVTGPGASQYASSLSGIITTGANAIKGASVNGFTGGDFRQGGWPAFLALTTVPANTPNGTYLQAQAALSAKIATQQAIKKTQLAQGNGFQSFTTCKADPNAKANANNPNNDNSGQVCTVQTPGNTISSALNKNLGIPQDNLLLANDMNAIINALFSQLVVQVLGNGLASVSKPNSSGQTYLDQIASSVTTQLQKLQKTIMSSLTPDIKNETTIAQNADTALAVATAAQTTLTNANLCYTTIASTTSSVLYPDAITYAQGQANQIQQIIASTTGPIIVSLTLADNESNGDLQSFNTLSSGVSSAQDVNDLSTTSDELQNLAESGNLPSAVDVLNSTNSLTDTESKIAPIQADASNRLSACEAFNPETYESELDEPSVVK
jgi:hypothetical protein